MIQTLIIGLVLVVALEPARHQTPAPLDALLTAVVAENHIPGMSVAVVRDGQVVFANGYGLANVELGAPATVHTVYEIGSISKQFTAAAIMLLLQEEKIALDDRVSHYLSDLPAAWSNVTIRQLLTHTSGVPEYMDEDYAKFRGQDVTPGEIIKTVFARPLDFLPGERYAYSNTNYTLLGLTIERISGKPYGQFMTERIFRPLGMAATRLNDPRGVIKNRASGYAWENETLQKCEYWSPSHFYASGGIVSTVADLVKWDAALSTSRLLKKSSWDEMWRPAAKFLDNGQTTYYGYGFIIGTENGHKTVWHPGRKWGFASMYLRFPDDRLTVILLANSNSDAAVDLPASIAQYFLREPTHDQNTPPLRLRDSHSGPVSNGSGCARSQ